MPYRFSAALPSVPDWTGPELMTQESLSPEPSPEGGTPPGSTVAP
jgi:hypothetical protein